MQKIFSLSQCISLATLLSVFVVFQFYASEQVDLGEQLIAAIEGKNCRQVQDLLRVGVEFDRADTDGDTPLDRACWKGYADIAALLIQAGAEVNRANEYGDTPLDRACWRGHKDIAALLIQAGAEVNRANKNGGKPLYKVCLSGHKDIAELFCRHEAHSLSDGEINKLPSERRALANECNKVIAERLRLGRQLLNDRDSNFSGGLFVPKVLENLIIQDMLGHQKVK